MTRQYPLPLPHRVVMGADDYLVTASNQTAMGWIDKWPDWSAPFLIVYGPLGSGKTHLAKVWQSRSQAETLSMNRLVQTEPGALAGQQSLWMMDDADAVAGNNKAEENLFHLYNRLFEAKGSLLLTAQQPVAQWPIKLPDLRSRLMAAPAVALDAPDDQLITGLLIKQFRDRQIDVGMDVVDYLLPRITRTSAAIRDIVITLDHASLARNRGITLNLAREILNNGE